MRAGLTLLVFGLNTFAAITIMGAPMYTGRKLAWLGGVTILPLVGAIAWLVAGRRKLGAPLIPTEPVSRA